MLALTAEPDYIWGFGSYASRETGNHDGFAVVADLALNDVFKLDFELIS